MSLEALAAPLIEGAEEAHEGEAEDKEGQEDREGRQVEDGVHVLIPEGVQVAGAQIDQTAYT